MDNEPWRGEAADWPQSAGRFERRRSVKPAARFEPRAAPPSAQPMRRRRHAPRRALPEAPPQVACVWAGLPFRHRQICRIGFFSAFCFLPLPLLSSSELEAGATESAAFSSRPSLSPALPTTGISLGRGFSLSSPCFEPTPRASTGTRPACWGADKSRARPPGRRWGASGTRHHLIGTLKLNGRAAKRRMQRSLPVP